MKKNRKKDTKDKKNILSLGMLSIVLLFFYVQIASADQILVDVNRPVVLDDPTTGTISIGFSNPSRSWGTDYWNGESTTIRAIALVLDNNGTPKSGVTVNFILKNPAGTTKNSASNVTNSKGLAYYSNDTNNQRYWGYWRIDATISGATNSSSFILNWWACASCHSSKNPGTWSTYTPKSYYVKGYNFHKGSTINQHTQQMSSGSCIACHQSYDRASDWHSGKLVCANCHVGSNLSTTPQGKNPEIAGCYDTVGCHTKKNTNLTKVNSTTGYIINGNYKTKYSAIPANSTKAHTVSDTVECIVCHSAGHNITKPYNALSTSNSNTENGQCWSCHTNRSTTHKLNTNCAGCHTQDAHNISIAGGGPDCISCHNAVGGSVIHKIDVSANTLSEHANLNSGATATVDPANKKCWGCHQTGGIQPTDMGDRYLNPYKCYDCHNATKPYANVGGALTVGEHFKSGTDIQTAISATDNSTSCLVCHNLAEMKVSYIDNEFTNYSLASHYGKNRTELRISSSTNCVYCHQNGSTVFSIAMSNANNKNMSNHSSNVNTPTCTNSTCHNSGKVHDSSLNKPTDSSDIYCKSCHSSGKSEHKVLYCTECHANNTAGNLAGRDIHGIKYLQKDNTFSTSNTNTVDCTTCHQSNVADSSLVGFSPPKIGNLLHHSDDIINGSKWGNYWTTSQGACIYCHNDTKHSLTALGRPLLWNPSYVLNTAIGSGTNCADCHYKGSSGYNAMSSNYTSVGLPIPPEITNGSWNGKSGYYNHTLNDYIDSQCKSCHDKSGSTTVGQIMHNVTIGSSGGPDCKLCHDVSGSAPAHVNFSVMNDSKDGHKNLNSAASATVNAEDKKCWACHGDGTQPNGHPVGYKTPLGCTDCHISGNYSAPIVAQHSQVGQQVITAVNCTQCHSNVGMYLDGGGVGTITHYYKEVTNMATQPYGHLGSIDTSNCIYCHNGPNTGNPNWGSPVNISTSIKRIHTETTTAQCDLCHKDASVSTLANVDFHNAAVRLGTGQGSNCLDCHTSAI